jgi:hypothetical protein
MSTSASIQLNNVAHPFDAYFSHDGYPSFVLPLLVRFLAAGWGATYSNFSLIYLSSYESASDGPVIKKTHNNWTDWEYSVSKEGVLTVKSLLSVASKEVFHPLDYLKSIKNDCKTEVAKTIIDALDELEKKHGITLGFPKGKVDIS